MTPPAEALQPPYSLLVNVLLVHTAFLSRDDVCIRMHPHAVAVRTSIGESSLPSGDGHTSRRRGGALLVRRPRRGGDRLRECEWRHLLLRQLRLGGGGALAVGPRRVNRGRAWALRRERGDELVVGVAGELRACTTLIGFTLGSCIEETSSSTEEHIRGVVH